MCLNDSFRGIRHLRNPMALNKTGPIMAIFQPNKSKNVKNCKNIEKMVPSQFFLLNIMKLEFWLYL